MTALVRDWLPLLGRAGLLELTESGFSRLYQLSDRHRIFAADLEPAGLVESALRLEIHDMECPGCLEDPQSLETR